MSKIFNSKGAISDPKISGKRIGGTLEEWTVKPLLLGAGDLEARECIIGTVYDDDFWDDGMLIRSSLIESIDVERGMVETRNTIYNLGEKLNEEV